MINLLKKSNLKLDLKIADKHIFIPGELLTDLRTLDSNTLLEHVEQQIQLRETALDKKLLSRRLFKN